MGRSSWQMVGRCFSTRLWSCHQRSGKAVASFTERTFERVGGTKTLSVDIRLIAASNRDLEIEVAGEHFDENLFSVST